MLSYQTLHGSIFVRVSGIMVFMFEFSTLRRLIIIWSFPMHKAILYSLFLPSQRSHHIKLKHTLVTDHFKRHRQYTNLHAQAMEGHCSSDVFLQGPLLKWGDVGKKPQLSGSFQCLEIINVLIGTCIITIIVLPFLFSKYIISTSW